MTVGQRLLLWFKNMLNRFRKSGFAAETEAVRKAVDALQESLKNQSKNTIIKDSQESNKNQYSLKISKQEYAILRKKVLRKNAQNKGELQHIGTAYTANNFYVYENYDNDTFIPIVKLKM